MSNSSCHPEIQGLSCCVTAGQKVKQHVFVCVCVSKNEMGNRQTEKETERRKETPREKQERESE